MKFQRTSGLLLHITSLPGKSGSGTLGREAYEFADFLKKAGQSYWQILPSGPVCGHLDYSPYSSPSTFAGNILFIDLQLAVDKGWLPATALAEPENGITGDFVDFDAISGEKSRLLREAATRFFANAEPADQEDFVAFCRSEAYWLDDYALFSALSEHYHSHDWLTWEPALRYRNPEALQMWRMKLSENFDGQRFAQYLFFRQWRALKSYCNGLGIRLIGDIPFYVTFESADAWANPEIFQLHPQTSRPTQVAGVPPDYFSKTGQRWGNPLYAWLDKSGHLSGPVFGWWMRRIRHLLLQTDLLRIDHFRGFEAYWAIPEQAETAEKGKWVKGPGREFFARLAEKLGDLPLIAEDLGVITPEVEDLRRSWNLPGMKILQFAFDGDPGNGYLPHNYTDPNCLVYTGTHDNNTTNGWFYSSETTAADKEYILQYLGISHHHEFHWQLIRLALSSTAGLAILPLQDILGYAGEFRMNIPGRTAGNWRWRLAADRLTPELADRLLYLCRLYNRLTPPGGTA